VEAPGVGLLLVQQAVGEPVLAVEVRLNSDLAKNGAGDDGVLVVTEQFQPVRRLPQHRGSGLGGIAQPLGGLAGLMPLRVSLVPGPEPVGNLHVPGDAAVCPADHRGQLPGALRRPRAVNGGSASSRSIAASNAR
jgi:hypothetical protein